ncbi:PqqD family protein [Haloimpatiens sp. FM7315]|uniref:PqqD family protein n=1 Tax=Haloimpatiens sp. FM7315 TaxID=3298609 RepID=UPI0035A2CDAB
MKLKEGFITHNSNGENIMVAVGDASYKFHGLVRSNKTGAFIIDCLKVERKEEQIVEEILMNFDASREVVKNDVQRIIEILREIGAIYE